MIRVSFRGAEFVFDQRFVVRLIHSSVYILLVLGSATVCFKFWVHSRFRVKRWSFVFVLKFLH